jgi:hypothetical protein
VKAGILSILVVGVNLLVAGAALAHHSFAMEFDDTKPVTLTGIVTKVEWANPHVRFYLDVKDAGDQVTNWELTLPSTLQLLRRGWTRNLLVVGEMTQVDAFLARDGSPLANVWLVTLSNGRKVPSGLPVDPVPNR